MRGVLPGGTGALTAIALGTLALAGCLRDPVDVEQAGEAVVLVGLVSADTDTASVVLSRVGESARPERGATLSLDTPHGAVELTEAPPAACGLTSGWACYRGAYAEPPRSGEVYGLEGALTDGTTFLGATTVPAPPVLVYSDGPEAGSPIADTLRSVELRTPFMEAESPGGSAWVSILSGEFPADVWTADGRESCTTSVFNGFFDTRVATFFAVPVTEPVCEDESVAWDSMAVELGVEAFDPSLSSYWAETQGTEPLFPDQAAWGVDGVLGAFGSSATRWMVLIVTNPALEG